MDEIDGKVDHEGGDGVESDEIDGEKVVEVVVLSE